MSPLPDRVRFVFRTPDYRLLASTSKALDISPDLSAGKPAYEPDQRQQRFEKLLVCGAGSVGFISAELKHNISNHYQVVEFLRNPRRKGIDFLRVEWRILDVTPEAEWILQETGL